MKSRVESPRLLRIALEILRIFSDASQLVFVSGPRLGGLVAALRADGLQADQARKRSARDGQNHAARLVMHELRTVVTRCFADDLFEGPVKL